MKKVIKAILKGFELLGRAAAGLWVVGISAQAADQKPVMTEELKDRIGYLYQVNPDCAKEVLVSKTTHKVVDTIYVGDGCKLVQK